MSIGILIHNMILLLICLIFFRTVPVIAGVLIGAAAAEVLLISIARSTELCVESADGAYSSKKMVIHSLIRSLCAVYWCAFYGNLRRSTFWRSFSAHWD